jgi:hypothetical protein
MAHCSKQLEGMVDEVATEQIFGLLKNGLERLLEVRGIVGECDDANLGTLPGVLVIEFGDGYVEARAEPVFEAAQNLALVFQGMCVRDEDFQSQQTDGHDITRLLPRAKEERSFAHARDDNE